MAVQGCLRPEPRPLLYRAVVRVRVSPQSPTPVCSASCVRAKLTMAPRAILERLPEGDEEDFEPFTRSDEQKEVDEGADDDAD